MTAGPPAGALRWLVALALALPACAGRRGATRSADGRPAKVGGVTPQQGEVQPIDVRPVKEYNEAIELYSGGKKGGYIDYARVEGLLKKVLDKEPDLASAWFNLGVIYQEQGKNDTARDAYQKTLTLDPKYMDALANLGRMQAELGNRDDAIAAFSKAVEIDPFNAAARNNLAMIFRNDAVRRREAGDTKGSQKLFAQAVGHVRKVLAKDARNIAAYNNLTLIYYELGKFELAQLVCLNAFKFKIPDAGLHNNLGITLLKLGKVTEALAEFRKALEVDADHVPALMNLGAITLSYRDYVTAHAQFDRVVALANKNVMALLSRGAALRGLNKYAEAKADYDSVLSLDDKNADAYYNLGILHQQYLNDTKRSIIDYGNFLKYVDPGEKKLRTEIRTRIKTLEIVLKYEAEAAEDERNAPKEVPDEDEGATGGGDAGGEGGQGEVNAGGDDGAGGTN